MRFKLLCSFVLWSIGFQANAQTADTVTTGPGYANDVLYTFQTKGKSIVPNNNWHIAFQMIPQGGSSSTAGIIANHANTTANVVVYSLNYSAAAKFNTLSAADTVGKLTKPLFNDPKTWGNGAFNANRNMSNPFDYGWGLYDLQTHTLAGDSLYLFTVGSGATKRTYKFTVMEYGSTPLDSIYYEFRIAEFDGSGDNTYRIYRKDGFANRSYAYFDVISRNFIDRENMPLGSWDLLFTKYTDMVPGPNGPEMYPVTGVLSAPFVKVAEERMIAPAQATYTNQVLKADINEIGYDWKFFDFANNMFVLDTMVSYFVKTTATPSKIYQIHFTGFTGGATGKYIFWTKDFGNAVSIASVSSPVSSFNIAPNPSTGTYSLILDAKQAEPTAKVSVYDLTGKLVANHTVSLQKGLNALRFQQQLPNGNYLVELRTATGKASKQLSILN